MGQYHTIYNVTKKERYHLGGAKLWEKAFNTTAMMGLLVLTCNSNNRGGGDLTNPILKSYWGKNCNKLKNPKYVNTYTQKPATKKEYDKIQEAIELIQGRWAGDKILVQGDYAEKGDKSFLSEKQLEKFKDISSLVLNALDLVINHDKKDNSEDDDENELKNQIKWAKEWHV